MSDTTSAYPPPPPPGTQAPAYEAPAYPPPPATVLPNYQPPPISQPPAGYPMQAAYPQWQQAPQPGIGAGMGTVGILSQFSGSALWGCIVGLATVVAPFAFGYVFFFLPIVGLLAGFRALRSGKMIGGVVAIVLNVIGGLITIASLVIH